MLRQLHAPVGFVFEQNVSDDELENDPKYQQYRQNVDQYYIFESAYDAHGNLMRRTKAIYKKTTAAIPTDPQSSE